MSRNTKDFALPSSSAVKRHRKTAPASRRGPTATEAKVVGDLSEARLFWLSVYESLQKIAEESSVKDAPHVCMKEEH